MKIAITGAHSTGKSTLLAELQKIKDLGGFTFKGGITRDIHKQGININECGCEESQLLVTSKHIEHYAHNNIILDRCALDGAVYTAYLYEQGQVSIDMLKLAHAVLSYTKYDLIFYIKPEFDIVNDNVRSTKTEFRDRVAALFDEYIIAYNIPVYTLTGSVEQRVEQFMSVYNLYKQHVTGNVE